MPCKLMKKSRDGVVFKPVFDISLHVLLYYFSKLDGIFGKQRHVK